MKKIAYVLAHDINKNDGVAKKVMSQVDAWRKLGKEVEIFCIVPELGESVLASKQYRSPGIIRQRLLTMPALYDDVLSFDPDVVYYRYSIWSRSIVRLSRKFRIIGEINADDIAEYYLILKEKKSLKALARLVTVLMFRGSFLRRMSGIAAVTKELSEMRIFTKYCNRSAFFPNSINLELFPPIKSKVSRFERLSFFFIGSPGQSWHGLDIIARMAENLPDYDFHIVGIDGKSEANIHYYGYLHQREYMEILRKCHICIGTLALFRKGLTEACPLKVREYLAYGYPVIIGYTDTSFLNEMTPSWLYKIKDDGDVEGIRSFAAANKNTVISHSKLVSISSAIVECDRLNFMELCCRPRAAS